MEVTFDEGAVTFFRGSVPASCYSICFLFVHNTRVCQIMTLSLFLRRPKINLLIDINNIPSFYFANEFKYVKILAFDVNRNLIKCAF